jgi:hypothetical protein
MKEVFRHSDAGRVGVFQALLESEGIQTFVRNADAQQTPVANLWTALFPLPDFWPTLCVMNDDEYPEAMDILRDVKSSKAETQPEWTCPQCRERVPEHFSKCWNCGYSGSR